jgi:hypothetical protein
MSHGPERTAPASNQAREEWFRDEAEARGLRLAENYAGRRPLTIRQTAGVGVALWDYDGDGWLDVFLVGHTDFNAGGHGALLHNRGDGSFEDRTAGSGLNVSGAWHGCAVGDFDNDGRPDLFLTGFGGCRLFHNLGRGRFKDVTLGSGLEPRSSTEWATSAAFADVDCDGHVDLFVGRYVRFTPADLQLCDYHGVKSACGPKSYDPQQGALYRNLGGGKFQDVSRQWGLDKQEGKTLGVAFADANGDGYPDLYLANDEMPGNLFLNQEGRGFREVGASSGAAGGAGGDVQGGMGVDWGDYDGDGRLDLFVATFQYEDCSLYRNLGRGQFEHVSRAVGLGDATRSFVGFGARFIDFDRDGRPDLITANGHIQDNVQQVNAATTYRQPLQLFHNVDGKQFEDVSQRAGRSVQIPLVGRGLAVGDVDNDGDPDVVVTDLEGEPRLLINRAASSANWLKIQLQGSRSNRMGIGAAVRVRTAGAQQIQEGHTCGSYLSSQDPRLLFGLGSAVEASVEVRWPSGKITHRGRVAANQLITISEEE